MKPALADIRLIRDQLQAMAIQPKIIQTQAEADAINARERPYGLTHDWKVGDHYYQLAPHA